MNENAIIFWVIPQKLRLLVLSFVSLWIKFRNYKIKQYYGL